MRWEQPDDRHGRTAVFLLVAAILVAAALAIALAIALVAGVASQSSQPSGDVVVRGSGVTDGTSTNRDSSSTRPGAAGSASAGAAAPGAYGNLVITGHRSTSAAQTPGHGLILVAPHPPESEGHRYVVRARLVSAPRAPGI